MYGMEIDIMWLKPQGYAVITSPDSGRANLDGFQCAELQSGSNEYDTTICNHCNSITHVKARMRPEDIGGLCKICMGLICPKCLDFPCIPFLKRLDEVEKRDIARRSYGL